MKAGRTTIRLPADLQARLTERAEREGVSVNTLIVGLLAGSIAWRPARD